jgi:Protein of unknown function (DUF1036)
MALYLSNIYESPVWVALAFYDATCGPANQNFRKRGWWELQPYNGYFNVWNVDLRTVNRFAYVYAESAHDGVNWSGTGNSWLNVTPISGFDLCAFETTNDDQWVDFYELDFTWAPPGWDLAITFWRPGAPEVTPVKFG